MFINRLDISGELSNLNNSASGGLQKLSNMSGDVSIPEVIQKRFTYYDTTENWNSKPTLIAERGCFYVYSDYLTETLQDGSVVTYPGVKIGDGTSYLIDMPVSLSGRDSERYEDYDEHIRNILIHVGADDRDSWDNKVTVAVDDQNELLFFTL